jgi:hypothetical protein
MIRREGLTQPFQGGQPDQEVAEMVELQDEEPPAARLLECELMNRDRSPGTCDDLG